MGPRPEHVAWGRFLARVVIRVCVVALAVWAGFALFDTWERWVRAGASQRAMVAAVRTPAGVVTVPLPVTEFVRRATMFAAAIAALLVGERWIARWVVPLVRAGCPGCGYSMQGAVSSRCPECGLDWGGARGDAEPPGAAGPPRV